MIRETALQKKEKLIASLVAVRREILEAASNLSGDKQGAVFLGTWDIKDLLAHLIGWDYTNIQAAQEVMTGQLPEFYRHYDADWRSYNAGLVGRHRVEEYLALLAAVQASHQELVNYLERLPADELFKDRGIRSRGYKVIINRLLEAEIKDEKVHLAQILAYANRP